MNEKQYLISESELKELIVHHSVYQDNVINDFLDTKQPVKTLDREEVEKIIEAYRFRYDKTGAAINSVYVDNAITAICNLVPEGFELVASGKVTIDENDEGLELLIRGNDEYFWKVSKHKGKLIDIYIKERKK